MAMLTGLIVPSSGDATIAGKKISTQMDAIRRELGFCPQHDILFPELTVSEHLTLFAMFKGLSGSNLKEKVGQMIETVGLVEKTNVASKNLSGGMKRKLSVGIAFIGGSKVVLLDEPTSGMDPYSRRFTWNLIRKMREDRTIILTTHFMDEADLLGDRIAIMSAGKLRCVGSSLFLKNTFGVGYTLTIEKGMTYDKKGIVRLIKKFVVEGKELSDVGREWVWQLPLSASENFESLFEEFDANKLSLGIVNYGVSVTTLEEVFLKVAHGEDHKEASRKAVEDAKNSPRSPRVAEEDMLGREEHNDLEANKKKSNLAQNGKLSSSNHIGYFFRHMSALLTKRCLYVVRDKKAILFGFFLPVAFVILGLLIMKLTLQDLDQPSLVLTMSDFNPDVVPTGSNGGRNPVPYNQGGPSIPMVCNFGACPPSVCPQDPNQLPQDPCFPADPSLIPNLMRGVDAYEIPVTTKNITELQRWLLESRGTTEASRYGSIVYTDTTPGDGSVLPSDIALNPWKNGNAWNMAAVISLNYTSLHAAPIFTMALYEGMLRNVVGDDSVSLSVSLHPLPATAHQKSFLAVMSNYFCVLLVLIGFPFIPSSFILFVVREKENKSKHIQLVSGVTPAAFWLSTFFFDYCCYLVPAGVTIGCFFLFDVPDFTTGDTLTALILLFALYGSAMCGFCYCISFLFKSHSAAQIFVIFFSFLTGFMFAVGSIIASFFGQSREFALNIVFLLRLLPGFCLGHGLLSIVFVKFITQVDMMMKAKEAEKKGLEPPAQRTKPYGALHEMVCLHDIYYLAVESIVYVMLAITIEYVQANPSLFKSIRSLFCRVPVLTEEDKAADSDVIAEASRVLTEAEQLKRSGSTEMNDAIMVSDLQKVFPGGKFAVKGVSVGIPFGECFGLLGINGAG